MKKTVLIFIIVISIVISSCNSQPISSVYDVQLFGDIEKNIFNNDVEKYYSTQSSLYKVEEEIIQDVNIGKCKLPLKLTAQKRYYDGAVVDIYFDEDNGIEYSKSQKSFSVSSKGDVLKIYPYSKLGEKELLEHVDSFVLKYVEKEEYSNYIYSCKTTLTVLTETSAWKESKDCFYLPTNSTETITGYTVEYRRYSGDFQTSDSLVINCDKNGNVESFYYNRCDVDWDSVAFQTEIIEQSISSFLSKNLNSQYNLESYTIDSQRLVCVDKEIKLSLVLSLTLKNSSDQFVTLCQLMMSA